MKVSGYAAIAPKTLLSPYSFERHEPQDYDIVIDVHYCGICHSDIHQINDEWGGNSKFPMVPGHEITGKVASVGSKVTRFKKGDNVGIGCMVDSCRKCDSCNKGLEQYCTGGGPILTYNDEQTIQGVKIPTQGGYSNLIVVNQDFVLRIPPNIPLDKAAPLLCAGITLYSPLIRWNISHGKRVAIIGLGGLGHMGVKIAHALGAEVTVLSHTLKKQNDGMKMGADRFIATSDLSVLNSLEGYFDLIINTVSSNLDLNRYLRLLALDGVMVLVGIPENDDRIGAANLISSRRSLAGSAIGGIAETQEMLNFCSKNEIASDIETIKIDYVNEAYKRVLKSDVRYRFVIDIFNSLNTNK
jgi:uncharacterized zinc-type alcohol dehydrogenase-like protein